MTAWQSTVIWDPRLHPPHHLVTTPGVVLRQVPHAPHPLFGAQSRAGGGDQRGRAGHVDGGRDAGVGWEELSPPFRVSFSWSNNQLYIRQIKRSRIISDIRNPTYFRSSMTVGKIKHTCPSEPGNWKEVWGFKGRYLRQLEEEQVFVSEMCDVPYRWVTQIKFIFGSDSHSEKHHPQPPLIPAPSCNFNPSR